MAATARTAAQLPSLGYTFAVEQGARAAADQLDSEYREAGFRIGALEQVWAAAVGIKINPPTGEES